MTEFKKYTYWRIRRILSADYDCTLEQVQQGYKANRKPNFVLLYNLIDNKNGNVLAERITLNALRKILTEEGYTLHD